jgi:hypothetical protein
MSDKRTILLQLDTDARPSVFDRVVAIDAGADEVFSYGRVTPETLQPLVHGAIFTRGPKDLHRTAIFIGGSDVAAGERLLAEAQKHMVPEYGLRVSIMLDSNGANTTAVAAVRAAARHLAFSATKALVLGGTGPVGQRVALLLAGQGAEVRLASRKMARAEAVVHVIRQSIPGAKLQAVAVAGPQDLAAALPGRDLVIAAGAAGARLLPTDAWKSCPDLRVLIDLNAFPPLGIEGVEPMDAAAQREQVLAYGALGVGGTKMKIHRAAVARLFERNDHILDAEQIYALAQTLGG